MTLVKLHSEQQRSSTLSFKGCGLCPYPHDLVPQREHLKVSFIFISVFYILYTVCQIIGDAKRWLCGPDEALVCVYKKIFYHQAPGTTTLEADADTKKKAKLMKT